MIPTKIYSIPLTGNGSYRLQVAGRFWKIISATGQVSVSAPGSFGTLSPLTGGQGLEDTPFSELFLTDLSGSSNTVTLVVGDEKFIDTSLGAVSISTNKVPQLGTNTQTQKTVTNASGNIFAANAARQALMIQNNDAVGIIYVNLAGAAATAANGFKIGPGESLALEGAVSTNAITAIGSIASNANVVAWEGAA